MTALVVFMEVCHGFHARHHIIHGKRLLGIAIDGSCPFRLSQRVHRSRREDIYDDDNHDEYDNEEDSKDDDNRYGGSVPDTIVSSIRKIYESSFFYGLDVPDYKKKRYNRCCSNDNLQYHEPL